MQFTPTQKSIAAWGAIAAVFALALWLLGPVLSPFVVAMVLAYALTPVVDALHGLGRSRVPRVLAVMPPLSGRRKQPFEKRRRFQCPMIMRWPPSY